MAPAQSALRSVEPHIHPFSEMCPTCQQPIPNEKAREIRVRAAAMERRLAEEAEARATQKIATETARIEEAAKAKVEQAEREKAEAVRKANADTAAKIEAAKLEGQKSAEVRLAAAEKAKVEAEKAKADAEAAATQKVVAAEQAATVKHEEAQKQIDAANAKVREIEEAIEDRAREVREAMEKDKADAIAKKDSENDEKTRKLIEQVQILERKLQEKRADELGEGAHIQLLDALKKEFPEDHIERIRPGVSGADILHRVMRNGVVCGSILYESKNSQAWRDDYVTKLVKDQTAIEADHAILSTFKMPKDAEQVETRDSVIILKPARAVVIAKILRQHLLHVHTLRLSKSERQGKMAELYAFITSKRYALLAGRLDTESEALLTLQDADKKYHENHWKKEGLAICSIQKVKAEIDTAVDLIIGGDPQTELTE
jgi:hypothetical protein